ncbi:MAG TPA: hypothetical protein VF134_04315 [Candidatus Dormibacteraeota bacterium]
MTEKFKRARLSGSDELFRATRSEVEEGRVGEPPVEPVTETLSVELTSDDIRSIVEALQVVRFPERQRTRLISTEFERLGALQDRLRRLVAEDS